MNVLEVAIYAMVLTAQQPTPFDCFAVKPDGVNCTNGLAALPAENGNIAYSNGVTVLKGKKGDVTLSNGLKTFYDATAWISFQSADGSTLISVRKIAATRFKFSNGLHCALKERQNDAATCWRP